MAKDMSATEEWDDVYIDKDMGHLYRGGCSLHEHYENEKFQTFTTLVRSFEPYSSSPADFEKKIKALDTNLISAVANDFGSDYLKSADDLEVHTVHYFLNPNYSIIRFNIGVGGGNGTFIFYLKTTTQYLKVAQTFDGDVIFCDELVWINK